MERSPHPRLRLSSRGGTRLRTKCVAPPSPPAAAFDQYYRQTFLLVIEMNIKIARRKTPKPPYWHCLLWLWTAIFCWKDKDISGALWLQWDAEEVKYVTMSHGRSTHRVKNVLLPCRPFPGGQKWKCTFAFAFEWLLQLTVQRASEKRHWRPLSDVLTGYTALVKREQVENDGRRRIFQSIPDGAVLRRVTCK